MPSLTIRRGETVTSDQVSVMIRDEFGAPVTPFYIAFSIFDCTGDIPYVDGIERRQPGFAGAVGNYGANFTIDGQANTGLWEIRWYLKRDEYASEEVIVEEFEVIGATRPSFGYEATLPDYMRQMVNDLRMLLADDAPDRRYHFRPPEHGQRIANYTSRFGYIWETTQLVFCLNMAVGYINLSPPRTNFHISEFVSNSPTSDWRYLLLLKAASIACKIEQLRWIADEFNYSIGSLSLDITKSDKYSQMGDAFDTQFETSLELAKRTLKYTLGLKMSRFSGVSGLFSFGPSVSRVGLINYPAMLKN